MDLVEARERGVDDAARHPWEIARLDVLEKLLSRHVTLAPDSLVVDVGCGDTFVVEQLAAEHPRVSFYAIDTAFTDELIVHARAHSYPNVRYFKSLDAIVPTFEQPVSLVLLMDVIEHIEDEKAFLADLVARPYIGRDTRFVITVPAYQSLFCSHDTFLGHYRRYSSALLRTRLEGAGLMVIDTGRFFFSLVPARVLQVLKERLVGVKPERATTGVVAWSGGRARTTILTRMLALDATLGFVLKRIGVDLAGLSNYAICQKSAW